jgi:hypothetical protein
MASSYNVDFTSVIAYLTVVRRRLKRDGAASAEEGQ